MTIIGYWVIVWTKRGDMLMRGPFKHFDSCAKKARKYIEKYPRVYVIAVCSNGNILKSEVY